MVQNYHSKLKERKNVKKCNIDKGTKAQQFIKIIFIKTCVGRHVIMDIIMVDDYH